MATKAMRQGKPKSLPERTDPVNLEIASDEAAAINQLLAQQPHLVLQIPRIREIITAARIKKLKPGDIRSLDGDIPAGVENVVNYNIEGVTGMWALGRPSILINPLASSQYISRHVGALEVLSIGPRTEAEIFALMAAGFNPKRIRGLDIISYSPFIDLGDMHDMPYPDASFDVIILGWVLAYSTDNKKAASEVLRIARPNAFVAVGCEYNPKSNAEIDKELEGKVKSKTGDDVTRFVHSDQILALFEGHIQSILYRDDVHPTMRDQPGAAVAIFQLKG